MEKSEHSNENDNIVISENESNVPMSQPQLTEKKPHNKSHSMKLLKDALQESDDRYKILFSQAMDGIFIVDTEGQILVMNDSFAKMHGYGSSQEMAHVSLSDLDTPETARMLPIRMQRILNGEDIRFEVEHYHRDGHIFPLLVSCNKIMIDKKPYVMAFHQDITERKQAEEAQQRLREQEKHVVVGRLAANIAHDFNNIVGIIMGYSHLLLNENLTDAGRVKVNAILESSMRGRDLTKNLTLFARDTEPNLSVFNLNEKINLVLGWLQHEPGDVNVSLNYGSGLENILADEGMFENAMINLIQNSLHAMSKTKKPEMIIRTYAQKHFFYIEIEDNGCGVPDEWKDKIFDPMVSLKGSGDVTNSYRQDIKGNGYGLANVRKWVDKFEGDIKLESAVGKGTRFKIKFPLLKGDLVKDEVEKIKQHKKIENKKILVVEDEPLLADILIEVLEAFNHKIDMAADSEIALGYFEKNVYDAISLDYMLPGGINGLDVYRKIRETNKDIPIIFVSGNFEFMQSVVALKQNDPNMDYLAKPFDNMDYVNKIHEWLAKSSSVHEMSNNSA